jgi:alpha-L-fucosidase
VKFSLPVVSMLLCSLVCAQTPNPASPLPSKMEWFVDAKLGIFIHYGIYAVHGTAESWAFYNNEVSYADYMEQLKGFTARNYHPEAWARLFKEAGARYAVLTSKHHDGVALWDTKLSDLSVVKKTPAGRDLLTPYADALRKEGLKVGIYFSHLDWSNPDYATVFSATDTNHAQHHPYDYPQDGREDLLKWNRFLAFRDGQIRELQNLLHPDLWWFDGDWTRTAEQWKMKELRDTLLSWNPRAILNARMQGYGDYATPEQGLPVVGPEGPWELCMTINDSWGYRPKDTNQKSVNYIIRVFTDCISMGGNLLLDVGPKEDGTITPEQTTILRELGRWTTKHQEAIFGTRRGIPCGHFYGPTTLSKDRRTLYCFVLDIPRDDIVVKGIQSKIRRVRLVGTDDSLHYKIIGGAAWVNIPGTLQIHIPADKVDQNVTVVAVDLDAPLTLYRGKGGV